MKQYTVGALVFCDFHFSGKPTGKVVEVVEEGDGKHITTGRVRVKITKDSGAYKRGEIVTLRTFECVPLRQRFKKRGSFFRWVNTNYQFVKL